MNFNTILEDLRKRYVPFEEDVKKEREPKNLIDAIKASKIKGQNPVISEIKYRSPTKNTLKSQAVPEEIALKMERGGASAISVLTEEKYFGGNIENLRKVRTVSSLPLLRKDFIFHHAQIREAYYYGADSILLISSFFNGDDLKTMIDTSREYGMEPLVEIHSLEDIKRAEKCGAKLFGINNRDKDTLKIDLKRTEKLSPYIDGVKVSASGIETPAQLKEVLNYADAALIGSSIMNSNDITAKVAEFVEK